MPTPRALAKARELVDWASQDNKQRSWSMIGPATGDELVQKIAAEIDVSAEDAAMEESANAVIAAQGIKLWEELVKKAALDATVHGAVLAKQAEIDAMNEDARKVGNAVTWGAFVREPELEEVLAIIRRRKWFLPREAALAATTLLNRGGQHDATE